MPKEKPNPMEEQAQHIARSFLMSPDGASIFCDVIRQALSSEPFAQDEESDKRFTSIFRLEGVNFPDGTTMNIEVEAVVTRPNKVVELPNSNKKLVGPNGQPLH